MSNKQVIKELNNIIQRVRTLHNYIDRYTYDVMLYGFKKAIEKIEDEKTI